MSADLEADRAKAMQIRADAVAAGDHRLLEAGQFADRLLDVAEMYKELHGQRGEDVLAQVATRRATEARARRYLLAWRNARERAAAFNDALVDAQQERDALRAELANTQRAYMEVCTALRELP